MVEADWYYIHCHAGVRYCRQQDFTALGCVEQATFSCFGRRETLGGLVEIGCLVRCVYSQYANRNNCVLLMHLGKKRC